MISEKLKQEVLTWIKFDPDPNTAAQLSKWLELGNEAELKRCFNGFLQFGTAGLRGPLGPGPSCMNRAVVSRTASGITEFMKKNKLTSIVIGRDSRYGSFEFAKDSAQIFSGAGIKTYLLPRELPTPVLAFAVKKLKVDVGVMVTASHNPATDNGYKVYLGGEINNVSYHGSQIIPPVDNEISYEIARVNLSPERSDKYEIVAESVIDEYVSEVAKLNTSPNDLKIVYTALHGVGTETFKKVLQKAGFKDPILVTEQINPDPEFPTTKFPNPEESGVMDLAIDYAKRFSADIVIANDPDADRCAIAVKNQEGTWRVVHGDEVGVAIGYYIIKHRNLENKSFANSLVSSSLLSKIAKKNQVNFHQTLTGFKWISKVSNLAYGYEEALGYCVAPEIVNDKDGISAAIFIAQLINEIKLKGKTFDDYLDEIGKEFGFHQTGQISIRVEDMNQIDKILNRISDDPPMEMLGSKIETFENLSNSKDLKTIGFRLNYAGGTRVIIRPSGTEPKLKCYIEVITSSKSHSKELMSQIKEELTKVISC